MIGGTAIQDALTDTTTDMWLLGLITWVRAFYNPFMEMTVRVVIFGVNEVSSIL